ARVLRLPAAPLLAGAWRGLPDRRPARTRALLDRGHLPADGGGVGVTEQAAEMRAAGAALQDFPVTEEAAGRIVGRELLALAAASLLYPLGLWRSVKRTPRRAQQRTIVLVHGYLA